MTVKEIAAQVEALAPLHHAEDFDNVGLLVGRPDMEVTGVLVTLDTLEAVVDEAIARGCNLILSFHPILFKGLKRLTGKTYVERVVARALENQIAIYSIHTALDNVPGGVNGALCQALGIQDPSILIPKKQGIKKLVTYVPKAHTPTLLDALFAAGAGSLGHYSQCSFRLEGEGSFLPSVAANPALGTPGTLQREPEDQLHLTFTADREASVLAALFRTHPYEEVAYEVTTLENDYNHLGMGMIGSLEAPLGPEAFLEHLKQVLGTPCIRHSALPETPVQRVAVLGGSGAFAIEAAKAAGADAFVTGDVKYHQFFQAEGKLLIADVGHYETEQFTKRLLCDYLSEKIPNFAISLSETKTNPVNYF
ncbi:Nif3-like dinuclear metal center hexameric protein [Robiginitalea sp. M366]|uniref:Nif3-like dinuclear metal center hexameric protein n=1 Tax=Robiginitalea aestuariiviva TaxID=3036903 RepID=UPI00240D5000|nr:Nif3-like dinuclear metal center hexameric protein [Robiginitalea aestuariiviva]MDG1570767.1 Nif3-like dinuclear metal center hexameric protein [Robiginitalea aestuariiviva]